MLTQQENQTMQTTVSTTDQSLESLLQHEWLLTNGCGGYSASTVVGCNTRGYHGLLVGSMTPPTNRIMALANCLDMVVAGEDRVANLSTCEFAGKFTPEGYKLLKGFRQDTAAHFDFACDTFELTKSVYLLRNSDTVALVYDFKTVNEPVKLVVRPLIGLRDFHTRQKSYAHLCSEWNEDHLTIHHDTPNSCRLLMSCPGAEFETDAQWWFNFMYRADRKRGQDHTEDLWTPGFFHHRIDAPQRIVMWASLTPPSVAPNPAQLVNLDLDLIERNLDKHARRLTDCLANPEDENLIALAQAADQFIVRRRVTDGFNTTILAGYPWFADWGRDAFISLPGLLLCTGRLNEAKNVLRTFAHAADGGMIPNRFDDRSDTAHYNSVDASLWFVNAAFQYLGAGGDWGFFGEHLLPTIQSIIHCYQNGTRFGIHADEDGLISAGDDGTQLTWMDARFDGVSFTPRFGKAVEVNALWYNALRMTAEFFNGRNHDSYNWYTDMADTVADSFRSRFWNEEYNFLNDCILPDGSYDASLRPNQIFAVSLQHSPLSTDQQKQVVDAIEQNLLTPYGLRTLSPKDPRYQPRYAGPQRDRDAAYHQGTVWPYLIGPFVEACLKVNDFSDQSKQKCRDLIAPLCEHLKANGCLGSISEIFDGDQPQHPKGCFAQAWSVAELLRAYMLINYS